MKKKVLATIGMVALMGCMTACGQTATTQEAATTDAAATDAVTTDVTTSELEVYTTDDYSFSYSPSVFEIGTDRNDNVIVNYVNAEVQAPGSNEIIISKDEGITADELANMIAGDDAANVSDGSLGEQAIPVKTYTRTSESPADASLTLVDSFMIMQCGDDAITVNVIRTVGQDDETDMTVEGAFVSTLESFVLN